MDEAIKEKLVDLHRYGFQVEPRYYYYGWTKDSRVLARRSVALALKKAKLLLPKGYNFKIYDGQRSYETQKKMSDSFWRRLKQMHPRLGDEMLFLILVKYSGGVFKKVAKLDTHRNGGAIDLTIVDINNQPLYMGTDVDDLTDKAGLDYYLHRKKFFSKDRLARKNRLLLKRVMTTAGFKSYKHEWWHWTYDK